MENIETTDNKPPTPAPASKEVYGDSDALKIGGKLKNLSLEPEKCGQECDGESAREEAKDMEQNLHSTRPTEVTSSSNQEKEVEKHSLPNDAKFPITNESGNDRSSIAASSNDGDSDDDDFRSQVSGSDEDFFGSAAYHSIDYWDKRYLLLPDSYDWLQSYSTISWALEPLLTKESRILMIGCGNADFSTDMYDDGYENIVNIDLSKVVIEQMKKRHSEKYPKMVFEVNDATNLEGIESESFDAVIDKGLLDTLVCYPSSAESVANMFKETTRVLKPNGVFFLISLHSLSETIQHFCTPVFDELPMTLANCQRIRNPQDDSNYESGDEDEHSTNTPPNSTTHFHTFCVAIKNDADNKPYQADAPDSYASWMMKMKQDAMKQRELLASLDSSEVDNFTIEKHVFSILSEWSDVEGDESDGEDTQGGILPPVEYGDPEYWNDRYENDHEPFDWLIKYDSFREVAGSRVAQLGPCDKVTTFVPGCGNASFSADMYDDGYSNIYNVDLSNTVVGQMQAMHNEKRPNMKWILGDVTSLDRSLFKDDMFQLCVDKSTLDCLFCRPKSHEEIKSYISEVYRILDKKNGLFVCISLHEPEKVLELLNEQKWRIDWFPVPNPRWSGDEEEEDGAKEYMMFLCAPHTVVEPVPTKSNE